MSKGPHIAVVGAGIVGSAIALELASRGADVTLVDAGGERASENSFGWINASWFNRPDYFRLRHFSRRCLSSVLFMLRGFSARRGFGRCAGLRAWR